MPHLGIGERLSFYYTHLSIIYVASNNLRSYYNYIKAVSIGPGLMLWFISIKPILKENSYLTFNFKLFPFLVTSMSKTCSKKE